MQSRRFLIAVILIVGGSLLAHYVQNVGDSVTVRDLRFAGANGKLMSGLLYIPPDAEDAPAVLAVHGYINSRETQSGFAIELARRGFVVLALDQTGHGYSDPPAFSDGFGGPAGLAYLRSLPFVDPARIGMEGHSMGGWAVQMAADAMPGDYRAMVLEGSSTGTLGAPAGTAEAPRNLLVVFSRFDEFSALMWGAPVPADIVDTDKLKTLFGTDDRVVPGELYGDPARGTARELRMPPVTHPGDHLSTEAIGAAVGWLEARLAHDSGLPLSDQVWYWKELGTLLALVGIVVLIFPVCDWLLRFDCFDDIRRRPFAADVGRRRFAVNATLACVIPVVTFFPLQAVANLVLPANALLPQQITNGVVLWAWGTGLVFVVLFAIWFRRAGVTLDDVGLPASPTIILRSAVLALSCCGVLYFALVMANFLLLVDFRFWVVALKAMSPTQFGMFVIYLPLFAVFFVVLSLSMHSQLGHRVGLTRTMWVNALVLSGGFVVLLIVQYAPLLLGGTLTIASQPLLTIVAFQFVPLLLMVGLVSTYCYERTGTVYTGAFINALFVTAYMVAGTATQAVPFWF